jgi:hypothetical protein
MQPTLLQQILRGIGDIKITKDTHIPALVPGLVRANFGISERKVEFKQLCLAAYWVKHVDDVAKYEHQIKTELSPLQPKVLPYPFDTKDALIETIKELGKHFNCSLRDEQIVSRQTVSNGDFGKYYLFVVLITSFYYN